MASQTFDPIWEEKYASGHAQRYPWDVVVSFVFRNASRDKPRSEVRILEVGCGTASNLWFAAREGFQVAGVDGSVSAIDNARKRFESEGLIADLRVADFISLPFEDSSFDLAIDRGALVCAGLQGGLRAVKEIHRVLRPGGKFFFNPYSDRHSSASAGEDGPDGLTVNIKEGTMVGVGQICFYGRRQVLDVLDGWKILSMQHMEYAEMLNPKWLVHAEWRVVAEKE
jgi:ubiquinone/menaquinone biosynthesis C-methylase UbiE